MFKTGFKQVVLNSDPGMFQADGKTDVAKDSSLMVPGFGVFQAGQKVTATAGKKAVAGEYSFDLPTTFKKGDIVDVMLDFSAEALRFLPEMFSYREKKVISAKIVDPAKPAEAFKAAFDAIVEDEFFSKGVFSVDGSAAKVTIKMAKGYEGYELVKASVVVASDERPVAEFVDITTVTEASIGINTGKEIETDVRNAFFENIDPYGIHFGGNDQHVDVRGLYNSYQFSTLEDQEKGWAPHAGLGYGDANTETSYIPRDYIIYALKDSSADKILTTWAGAPKAAPAPKPAGGSKNP